MKIDYILLTSLLTKDENTLIVMSKSTLFELSNKNKIENSLFGSVDKIVWIKNLKCYKTNITGNNRENIVKLMVDMSKSPKLLYVKGMNLVSKNIQTYLWILGWLCIVMILLIAVGVWGWWWWSVGRQEIKWCVRQSCKDC